MIINTTKLFFRFREGTVSYSCSRAPVQKQKVQLVSCQKRKVTKEGKYWEEPCSFFLLPLNAQTFPSVIAAETSQPGFLSIPRADFCLMVLLC